MKLITICIVLISHFGRGDDTVGNPRRAFQLKLFELFELINSSFSSSHLSIRTFRAQIPQFEFVRAYPPIEVRQTVPCRAIRGNGVISQSKSITIRTQ